MNHISDNILNRYVDNELSSDELSSLNEHISVCGECLAKLKAQKIVENKLRKEADYLVHADFTARVMQKITVTAFKFKPKKSYFLRAVFSVFVLVLFLVVAFVFANIPASSATSGSRDLVLSFDKLILKVMAGYQNSISKSNISLIGTILTFILFVSGYFIIDSHRKVKKQIDKLV